MSTNIESKETLLRNWFNAEFDYIFPGKRETEPVEKLEATFRQWRKLAIEIELEYEIANCNELPF